LYSGSLISRTAQAFAAILADSRIPDFDVLFGPAYKGISLAAITAQTLYEKHGKDKAYCYNRKEKKDVSAGFLMCEVFADPVGSMEKAGIWSERH
jgi:orotate phosphoribosyltransferase